MRLRLSAIMALAGAATLVAAPVIDESSISLSRDEFNNLVSVTYTLQGEPAIVTLQGFTNNVALPWPCARTVSGDVCKLVQPGTHTAYWNVRTGLPNAKLPADALSVKLTAWSTNAPPPYLLIDLRTTGGHFFYPDADALPYGNPTNDVRYKTELLVMRRIPAAGQRFRMGLPAGNYEDDGKNPDGRDDLHYVSLSDDFYMSVFETTVGQMRVLDENTYWGVDSGPHDWTPRREEYPMVCLSYRQIRGSCPTVEEGGDGIDWPRTGHAVAPGSVIGKLRARTQIPGLDLPTAAQWEFACRAGTMGRLNVEGATLDEIAWYDGNSFIQEENACVRHIVGLKRPNAWGLYDMIGNLEECTLDVFKGGVLWGAYVQNFDPDVEVRDPLGFPESSYAQGGRGQELYALWGGADRVTKGGHCARGANLCTSGFCTSWEDYSVDVHLGFRFICPVDFASKGVPLTAADLEVPASVPESN